MAERRVGNEGRGQIRVRHLGVARQRVVFVSGKLLGTHGDGSLLEGDDWFLEKADEGESSPVAFVRRGAPSPHRTNGPPRNRANVQVTVVAAQSGWCGERHWETALELRCSGEASRLLSMSAISRVRRSISAGASSGLSDVTWMVRLEETL